MIYYSARPVGRFSMAIDWQAMHGADEVGPPRIFFRDALADLPPEADVSRDGDSFTCREPYRVRPIPNMFDPLLGWPHRIFGRRRDGERRADGYAGVPLP